MAIKDCTKKNLVGKPVIVNWVDSMSSDGWHKLKPSDCNCTTVGHYYSEDTEKIAIALNRSAYGFGEFIEIPKVAVKKVRKLKC